MKRPPLEPRTTLARAGALVLALALTAGCTPAPQAPGEAVAPTPAECQKTGQQCRIGGTNALGVCHQQPGSGAWTCTPQH